MPELRDLHIDIGAKDGDEARARVRIGDVAVIAGEPLEYPNGRIVSRSMDNRLGCFVAYEAARLVAEAGGAPGDVAGVAVTQEEITFAGARTTAYSLRPDVAIVVDVTFATDAPGHRREGAGHAQVRLRPGDLARLDARPAGLRAAARRGRGERASRSPSAPPRATRARTPTRCTSRAAASRPASSSIPLRYMHSPVEMVQLDDVENTREADRRLRAEAQRRRSLQALSRLLLLWDIDGTLLLRASVEHALALRSAIERRPRRRRSTASGWRPRGGPTRRSRATCCAPRASRTRRSTRARPRSRRPPWPRTRELCPPDLCGRVAPGMPELLAALAARARRVRLLARHRQPRADRAAQARGGRARDTSSRAGQGGFGSDAEDRGGAAGDRARARAGGWPRERTVVIGDTPRDIACARADGVRVVAVATGPFRRGGAGGRGRRRRRRPRPAAGARATGLRLASADDLRRAAAAAHRLRRGQEPAAGAGTRSPVAAPISAGALNAWPCACSAAPNWSRNACSASGLCRRRVALARARSRRSRPAACVPSRSAPVRISSTVVMIVAPPGEPTARNGSPSRLDVGGRDRGTRALAAVRARSGCIADCRS